MFSNQRANTKGADQTAQVVMFCLSKPVSIHKIRSLGAQWLSGRVLDSRPKGSEFEPHRRHCAVVLGQDTFYLT